MHALLSVKYPDESHDYFNYDNDGRLIETHKDGGAEAITYSYDLVGNKVLATDAAGQQSVFYFGRGGQPVKIYDGKGNSIGMSYDRNDQLSQITGASNQQYNYSYDSQGNMIAIEDPVRRTTALRYNPSFNNLSGFTDARGNGIQYGYDSSGNMTSITYKDGTSEFFTYDSCGNILTWANRRGGVVAYTYNARSQVTSKDYSDTPGYIDFTYDYDNAGNLISIVDANGITTMTYDPNTDWLTRIEYPSGHFFNYGYDNLGRRTKRTEDSNNKVNYIYDTLGRLDRMTDSNNLLIVDYGYDSAGRLIRKTLGNGVYSTYEYDIVGHLMHLINYKPVNAVLSRFDYTYDSDGKRTSMTTLDGTYTYGYDPLGQLTSVTYPDSHKVTYSYDPIGNRISVNDNGLVTAYTTNNMNQYTVAGDTTYTYDADGDLKTKIESGVTTTYAYDIENRLIGVSTPTDTWTYKYDAFGNRIASLHNGARINYIVDPIGYGNVVAEYDCNENLVARYDHGYGLLARTEATGIPAYYTFDAIGSTSEITDPTGTILNSYKYDPFGISLHKSESIFNPFEYVGEYGVTHETYGLEFMRARYYDSILARFMIKDPVGINGGDENFYRYALNRPIDNIDPMGLGITHITVPGGVVVSIGRDSKTGQVYVGLGISAGIPIPSGNVWTREDNVWGWSAGWPEVIGLSYNSEIPSFGAYGSGWWGGGISVTGSQRYGEPEGKFGVGVGLGASAQTGSLWGLPFKFKWWLPSPPTQPDSNGSSGSVGSMDPDSKIGPKGFGSGGFIVSDPTSLVYTIYFENDPNATASARDVHIEDQLNSNLDWTTFELLEVGFGKYQVAIPAGMTHYEKKMEIDGWTWGTGQGWHTGQTPLIANIDTDIDISTGKVSWRIVCSDPQTGWEPDDAYAGFLPPEDASRITNRGEGYVSFRIKPKTDLSTGTEIRNSASIVFDVNPPIVTPQTLNTIDSGSPSSKVLPLPTVTTESQFLVEWSGQDDAGGSGIAYYDIFVSVDKAPFTLWQSKTTQTSAVFTGGSGHSYAFYSIATDNVNHAEQPPSQPDATTTVVTNRPPVANAGPDQTVERTGAAGAQVQLDGSASFDPDGDNITYGWTWTGGTATDIKPTVVLPLGLTTVTLTVSDGKLSCIDTVDIKVVDTTPPVVIIKVPQANASIQGVIKLAVQASDFSGVASVYFSVREPNSGTGVPMGQENLPATFNSATGKWECNFNTTKLPDGYYVVLAKATDTYGNTGFGQVIPFSICNWAIIPYLPCTPNNKAGRTVPVKFSLKIAKSVDPKMPFVYRTDLEIRIYDKAKPSVILQRSVFGCKTADYRIDMITKMYITNFKTATKPATYVVEIWRPAKNFKVGSFIFATTK